jgi:hypothetical protein
LKALLQYKELKKRIIWGIETNTGKIKFFLTGHAIISEKYSSSSDEVPVSVIAPSIGFVLLIFQYRQPKLIQPHSQGLLSNPPF